MPRTGIALLVSMLLSAGVVDAHQAPGQASSSSEPAPVSSRFLGGFLKRTSIVYPLAIGDWQAEGERIFEMQEAGVSVAFRNTRHPDRAITVYFYPAGVVDDDVARQAAEASIADIKLNIGIPGGYDDVEMSPLRAVPLQPATGAAMGRTQGWSLDMRVQREGRTYHSAMLLLADRLYFVKGRLSLPGNALSLADTSRALQAFMGALLDRTTISSTGDCWDPSRQVEKARRLDGNGPPRATRSTPGCEAPTDVLPIVPNDMREIRLEYRVPGENESGSPQPWRAKRSGIG